MSSPRTSRETSTRARLARLSPAKRALWALATAPDLSDPRAAGEPEPIAVIGMGLRGPGKVDGPEAFWHLLREGVDTVGEVPTERWDADALHDPDPEVPGRMITRQGAFVSGVDRFDAGFFNILPREARNMDPQQRMLLEVAWEALEHAGQPADRLRGSDAGVFMAVGASGYRTLLEQDPAHATLDVHAGVGNSPSFGAGRLRTPSTSRDRV